MPFPNRRQNFLPVSNHLVLTRSAIWDSIITVLKSTSILPKWQNVIISALHRESVTKNHFVTKTLIPLGVGVFLYKKSKKEESDYVEK